ncbi:MAG: PmoA family protein [Lentisphaeraceae bacterium]|nr:PmoA family protein [Lentisphaeraceae bacterium]
MSRMYLLLFLMGTSLLAENKILDVVLSSKSDNSIPIRVNLPESYTVTKPLTVIGKNSEKSKVLSQYDPQNNCLWFIPVNGGTKYEIRETDRNLPAAGFINSQTSEVLNVKHQDQKIFDYHHAHEAVGNHKISDKFLKQASSDWYVRSAFIHPLYSPQGKLVTDNFPLDHPHHKGLWFAWTNTEIDGKKVDFWNLGSKQGTVQFDGFESTASGAVFSEFKVNHKWINFLAEKEHRVALKESWNVKTFALSKGKQKAWVVELVSTQKPLVDIHLPEYRYGGFAYRGAKEWVGDKHIVLTAEGKTKKDAHLSRGKWIAYSGKVYGDYATVALFSHPENFRFPEPFRVWPDKGAFLNVAPSQQGSFDLKKGQTYTWKYSLVIHDGEIDAAWLNKIWEGLAKPAVIKVD